MREAPERIKVDSDRARSANERERARPRTYADGIKTPTKLRQRIRRTAQRRPFVFVRDHSSSPAWSESTFTGKMDKGRNARSRKSLLRHHERDRPQIARGLLTLVLTRDTSSPENHCKNIHCKGKYIKLYNVRTNEREIARCLTKIYISVVHGVCSRYNFTYFLFSF